MKKIDLQIIIDTHGLDKKNLAEKLFPNNKYPKHALDRVIEGYSNLDSDQLIILASEIGSTVDELYSTESGWTSIASKGLITFKKGNYQAVYNPSTQLTHIYKDGVLIKENAVIITDKNASLDTFVNKLNSIISTF